MVWDFAAAERHAPLPVVLNEFQGLASPYSGKLSALASKTHSALND